MNGVFVEVLDEFDLKTFRDLGLAVIPRGFVATDFLYLLSLIVVLDSVGCIDLSEWYEVSFLIRSKDRVCLDRCFLLMIRSAAESVGSAVLITFSVDNDEIEFREEFHLSDLSFVEFLICCERCKVLVVGVYLDLVCGAT